MIRPDWRQLYARLSIHIQQFIRKHAVNPDVITRCAAVEQASHTRLLINDPIMAECFCTSELYAEFTVRQTYPIPYGLYDLTAQFTLRH